MLSYATVFVFLCISWTLYWATSQPTLGLRLHPNGETGAVEILETRAPSSAVAPGSELVALGSAPDTPAAVNALDLVEEPDFFDEYEDMRSFFARQSELAQILRQPEVWATVRGADGTEVTHRWTPRGRSTGELPFVFWFQCAAGSIGFLVGAWVLIFNPRSLAARLFAAMGTAFMMFTFPAAAYSTRELAIDGEAFRILSGLNHAGAFLYGTALVALFMSYPVPLVPTRALLAVPVVFVSWLTLHLMHWTPDQDTGSRLPILLQMSTAIVLVVVQWRATRKDPSGRAVVRWFGSAVIVGSSLFVFTIAGTALVGDGPPIPQGYAFGFFLLMDVGVALGLRRHQLLGLDEWALRVLSWLGIAIVFVLADIAIAVWLSANATVSVSLALLICGFVYIPLRAWLWRRLTAHPRLDEPEMFQAILSTAFAPSAEERPRRVRLLLSQIFDPLEIKELDGPTPEGPFLDERGLRLCLPPVASSPALQLRYPWRGRRLFTPRHLDFANAVLTLLRRAETAREAFLRGVGEERRRIARDLHDSLGAHLLSGLYADSISDARTEIRQAIADMRSVVSELREEAPRSLEQHLADLRGETETRLRAASIRLDWPPVTLTDAPALPVAFARNLTFIVRELVSNVIHHSQARELNVRASFADGTVQMTLRDDGIGVPESFKPGNGWSNVRERSTSLGGEVRLEPTNGGACVKVVLPLQLAANTYDSDV